MISVTRAEVCAVACAELFRDAGEIMASPMTTVVQIGARLARLTFSPDIVLTDGEARILADTPAIGAPFTVEGWMPFGRVFETLAWGRRHVVMGANQIDRYGNQNISLIGDWDRPKRQLIGVRGAPGNTANHRVDYWVSRHSARVFVEAVDMVSGVGNDRARQAVARPVDGTMLTVLDAMATEAREQADDGAALVDLISAVRQRSREALRETTLPGLRALLESGGVKRPTARSVATICSRSTST